MLRLVSEDTIHLAYHAMVIGIILSIRDMTVQGIGYLSISIWCEIY